MYSIPNWISNIMNKSIHECLPNSSHVGLWFISFYLGFIMVKQMDTGYNSSELLHKFEWMSESLKNTDLKTVL